MKQFALMCLLAGLASVGCNPVKGADPEPTAVKAPIKPAEAAPATIPASAPAAVPAQVAEVPAAAGEAAADATAVSKKASASVLPKGKAAAASDRAPRVSKKGGVVTSF